jgi:hypothetical protein
MIPQTITKQVANAVRLFVPDVNITPQDLRRIMITAAWNRFATGTDEVSGLMERLAEYLCTSVQMFKQHYVCENRGVHQAQLVEFVAQVVATSPECESAIRNIQDTMGGVLESPFKPRTGQSPTISKDISIKEILLKRYFVKKIICFIFTVFLIVNMNQP